MSELPTIGNWKLGTRNSQLLLGHRGARLHAQENTIAAFELALAHGCDGFEFDVRRTADGRAVVCHDPYLSGLSVARHSYAMLIQASPELASLEDVLARFASRAYLYIELKVEDAEAEVLRLLHAYPPQCGYAVASFLPDVLKTIHLRSAEVPLGLICGSRRQLLRWASLPVSTVMMHYRLASEALIRDLHAAGKQVFVWTVNRPDTMKLFAARGVNAILSDDTALLVRTFRAGLAIAGHLQPPPLQ